MSETPIGRLERTLLRDAWKTEDGDFTPWLAREDNLNLVGDAIGLELELEGREVAVGPFRADILCKDTVTGDLVLIENQLERTDHSHLGQILTYAAGLQAVTVVWVSARFTEQHRAAMDWLNSITDQRISFFALEVELWRIGDSQVAPKLNVVSEPNEWSRTVTKEAGSAVVRELAETGRIQLAFWTELREVLRVRNTTIKPPKPRADVGVQFALGRSGFRLNAIASFRRTDSQADDPHELRAEVVLSADDARRSFDELKAATQDIEREFGERLIWHESPKGSEFKVIIRRTANLMDRSHWPEYHEWLIEKLERLHKVFAPRVRDL